MDFRLFIPITKIDVAKRLVTGTIAEEIPDHAGEIMDYETAKPMFEAWSAEIAKASNGKSVGNLRAMHSSVAAGKLDQIHFDDDARRIATVAKVVDDAEWRKVLEGVYTGFSMGGRYVRRWPDPEKRELMRYTPQPMEVSLVDHPCIPSATFEVIKADGTIELRKFKQPLAKDLGDVSDLASIIGDLSDTLDALDTACSDPSVSDALKSHIENLIAILQSLVDQAGADFGGGEQGDETDDSGDSDAPDDETVDDADDDDDALDGAEKSLAPRDADLRKSFALVAPRIDAVSARLEELSKRLEQIEAQPLPGGPVVKSMLVTKMQDMGGAVLNDPLTAFQNHLAQLPADQRAHLLTKLALRNPL